MTDIERLQFPSNFMYNKVKDSQSQLEKIICRRPFKVEKHIRYYRRLFKEDLGDE